MRRPRGASMRLTGGAGVLFAFICAVQQASSESKIIHRKPDPAPTSPTNLEEIGRLVAQIHSLSDPRAQARSSLDPLPVDGTDINAYYSIISTLYVLLQPLMREGFVQDLPQTLVCVLSERQDCGTEAELIKTVSTEMGPAFLTVLRSLTSPTCSSLGAEGKSYSFVKTYFHMSDSTVETLSEIQDMFFNILTYFPGAGDLVNAVSGLVDTMMKYMLEVLFSLLEVPIEYVVIALQIGIRVPTLDEQGMCEQGDLKQLIMWGLRHNVSWSFSTALIDILLDVFLAPDQSLCSPPGSCPPSTVPLQRSYLESNTDIYRNILLQCDHQHLAKLNDTICPEIVSGSRQSSSAFVLMLCQALSSLSMKQIESVWRNGCYIFEAVMSPLASRTTANCPFIGPFPSPGFYAAHTLSPLEEVPLRIVREASNLNQLACNYNSWINNILVDPVLVSLCGDNQREEFVQNVCNNASLIKKLVSDPTNYWLYAYCGNSSADLGYMVNELCLYEQWMFQATEVNSYLLEFCMILDKDRLSLLICQNIGFFMLLFPNPGNLHLIPNCTAVLPISDLPPTNPDSVDPCQYSHWHEPTQVHMNIISICSQFDAKDFTREVCSNQTFLNELLINKQNEWLQPHCAKAVLDIQSLDRDNFNATEWCDYQLWVSRYIDDSVVGLCWQHDSLAFQNNVCCNLTLLQWLLQDPLNVWLRTACNDTEEIDKAHLLQQVCRYTEWTKPTIVDMTEVAVCAERDPDNFISKVCLNDTVLKNLLANQDNVWLIQHCSKHTTTEAPGGGQGFVGFNPNEHCQYLSWSGSLPESFLITLCWEHDQANFVSVICPNKILLSVLSNEPSSAWVTSKCAPYANLTGGGGDPMCLAQDLAKKFNWTCTQDLTRACHPEVGQNAMLQVVVRCWLETMRSRMEEVLTPQVTTLLDQAVSLAVVSLLALEEIQNTTYHVTQNIRLNVLMAVDKFLKKETNFDKKRVILQCFGRVLTSLMQTPPDTAQEDFVFFQEFFNIPVDDVRGVLSGSHISTIRMLLVYYSRHKNSLQLPQKYLPTLASVLFQTHLSSDATLFFELAPLLTLTSPSDILAMPLLQKDNDVREIINLELDQMTLEQRLAFGAWFGTALDPISIIRGQQSLIRAIGNLSAYLPFYYFQHLSAAQLLDGLDVLMNNTLSPIKQEFIAQRVIGTYSNLTAQDFIRLGNITCHADPEDLIAYNGTTAFPVIQEAIRSCALNGLDLPSRLLSLLLLNSAQSTDPSTMTAEQSSETAHLLPMLGASYIQSLSPQNLLQMLPVIKTVTFSPAQASIIVQKLSSVVNLNSPGTLQQLGSLVVGVKSEFLLTLTSERLLSSLPSMAQQTPKFNPAQANAISTKLWGFLDVPSWLDEVEPLLLSTPLVSVMSRTVQLVNNLSTSATKPWNTQQAQAIFDKVLEINPSLIKEDFQSLGTLGQGVSCEVLLERLKANKSPSSVRTILYFLRQQLSPLHTTLKTCVVNEVNNYNFFIEVLKDFGAELALSIPLSIVRHFDVNYMDSLREILIREPQYFLKLSRRKQELLVDKIVQRLSMSTDGYTEEEFRLLGIMATFVGDELLIKLDVAFFMENLDFLKTLCYSTSKMDIVAQMLQKTDTFGPVETWTKATLSQVGRFIFFLPINKLQQIPLELMSVTGIERLFISEQQWERGPVGSNCLDASEKRSNFEKQQFVLQFFLGFLKVLSTPPRVPTCEILHSTTPSVWTPNSLANMSSSAFVNCLEIMGLDPFLSFSHRVQLLQKLKKLYGPVSSFSQSLISQLGRIAVEMTNEELRSLQLSDRNIISTLGAVDLWTRTQQEILFSVVLTSTQQSVSQLDSSLLVAMGHFVCGAKASQIMYFNAVEFSKAVLYLGQLKLQCEEEQLRAMIGLLSHALAFGPVPSWKSNVFMEIGIIAAGLTDIDMSSLVKDQIEGITPLAISAIPPTKFSVAVGHTQISMFSYDQADAVPIPVIDALSYMQKQALAMVLNPWDRLVDFRGRSLGLALSPCPVCVLLGSLMLMLQT